MTVSGIQKTTLIDYPDKVACTLFTHGCNFCCPFCHNPSLVTKKINLKEIFSEKKVFQFLNSRVKILDAVVITGGEPCLQNDLLGFVSKVKDMGFLVKVDTNGSFPDKLQELLEHGVVDYIAMDVKSDLEGYLRASGVYKETKNILRSIEIIKNCNVGYEFRSTVVKGIHGIKEIENMGKLVNGAKRFSLQNFKSGETISKCFSKLNEFSKVELENFQHILNQYVAEVCIKNIW
jgi:pyruvate formate lyase activating enzyme